MSIPLSGFVFPPESDQQQANEIGETISFPDDMVQTTDKGNELRTLLGDLQGRSQGGGATAFV